MTKLPNRAGTVHCLPTSSENSTVRPRKPSATGITARHMTREIIRYLIAASAVCISPSLWEKSNADETQTPSTTANALSDAAKTIQWSYLAPENGRPFNDPFARLTRDQLSDLSYVARIRRLIAEQKMAPDGDDDAEATRLSAKLTSQGIDVNWLLVQRQRVPEIRRRQITAVAESVAESMKSRPIELVGFATNIPTGRRPRTAFLLFPTATMCGHSTSPSPLHVVIVETDERHTITTVNTAIRVRGALTAHSSTTDLINSSGVQSFESAYKITPSSIEILSFTTDRLSDVHHNSLTFGQATQERQGKNQ